MRTIGVTLAGVALFGGAALVWSSGASAEVISFGGCSGLSCTVTQIGSSSGSPFSESGTLGQFVVTGAATATTDALSSDFDSQTIQLSTTVGGTLTLAFTVQDLTGPSGTNTWVSGFTSNEQTAHAHTVTESTYVDNGDGKFTTTTPLSSGTLTSAGPESLPLMNATASTTPLFSATELYKITLVGGCSADHPCTGNLTIDLTASRAVPEPMSLALFGVGLVGLGMARRKWS